MVIEMSGYASVGGWVGFNFLLITFVKLATFPALE